MPDKIIIRNQNDLNKHFELHDAECEYKLLSNNEVCRNYGYDEDLVYRVYGCPICLKEWQTTKESRNDRAKKMLDNFANIDHNVQMYQQFIKSELKKIHPDYRFLANCYIKIELLRQEEDVK